MNDESRKNSAFIQPRRKHTLGHIEVVHEPINKEPVPPAEPPRTILQTLFSIRGRISRRKYIAYIIPLALLVLLGVVASNSAMMYLSIRALSLAERVFLGCIIAVSLPSLWAILITLPGKRLHDTNRTGFWVILNFVGAGYVPLLIYLLLKSGSKGTNDHGIDPRGRETIGLNGFTNLMDAAKTGNREKIESIIRTGANINAQDVFGATAIMYAVLSKNSEAVRALLANGADHAIRTHKGLTPLRVATNNKLAEIEEMLLQNRVDAA